MPSAAGSQASTLVQFLTVLFLFIGVLFVTWLVTRWVGGYQKEHMSGTNVEVIETFRLSQNKLVQILRLGESYVAVAVCKDTVTVLREIPAEELKEEMRERGMSFRDLLKNASKNTTILGKSEDRNENE